MNKAELREYMMKQENTIGLILVLVIASLFTLSTIADGELVGTDTIIHAMSGAFIADLIRDGAIFQGVQKIGNYTWVYYAHYPVLGFLHWPPLLHVVEGIYFLFTGVSEVSARFLIYLFSIVGVFFYYRLLTLLYDTKSAFIASLLFITSPVILQFSRMVTAETPSLTMCLITIYCFFKYIRTNRFPWGCWTAIFFGLSLLVKQNAIFLVVFFCLYYLPGLTRTKNESLNYRHLLVYVLIVAGLAAPYYLVSFYYVGRTLLNTATRGTMFQNPYLSLDNYLFYLRTLPQQVSVITLILLAGFISLAVSKPKEIFNEANRFLLLWVFSCFLTFTLIAQKDIRYILSWVPALTGLAAFTLLRLLKKATAYLRGGPAGTVTNLALGLILSSALALGIMAPRAYRSGYEDLAKYLLVHSGPAKREIILYDGEDYGNLVFSLRENDPERKIMVFRSSKYFYAHAIFAAWGRWDLVRDKHDILNFLRKYGVRHIVVSFHHEDVTIPAIKLFTELLQEDPDFVLVKKFPIADTWERGGDLLVYKYKGAQPLPSDVELDIPMPILGRTIKITF